MSNDKELRDKLATIEKDMLVHFVNYNFQISTLIDHVNEILRRMQKLDEVYYHVFPERFEKDMKFENQLDKLNQPRDPGTTKK